MRLGTPREAYRRLFQPPVRRRYEHREHFERRAELRFFFSEKVRYDRDTECWTWLGNHQTYEVAGEKRRYPVFYFRVDRHKDATTSRSAFLWLMMEYFPRSQVKKGDRTSITCGNEMCISPYHRVKYMPKVQREARMGKHMSDEDVLRLYSLRGTMTQLQASRKMGVPPSTVSRVWSGKRWASITGHGRDLPAEQAS